MQTKEELVNHIRTWIGVENEIKELRRQMREKREEKKQLSQDLLEVMKENDIDCFDIEFYKFFLLIFQIAIHFLHVHVISIG